GELVTYTISIQNTGPSDARFVDVKDQLPAGLSLVSITASGGGACAGTLCQFGTVGSGNSRTVTVVARVGSDVLGDVTNTAAVDSVDNAAGSPRTDSETTTVIASATLAVTKVALTDPASAGGTALYQIVVTNEGPSDAQSVVVTDTLPAGMTYAGGDVACTASGQDVTCTVATLAAGASRSFLVQANVASDLADGISLTNYVTATSPTATNAPTDNATIAVRQASGGEADLSVSKEGPATVVAGEQIVYTLVVTNSGPATATAVSLVDALPDGVSFVDATSSQGLCESGVSCELGTLGSGATASIVVTGLVASNVVSGTALVNTAYVDSANLDGDLTNNRDTASTAVTAEALVSIVKDVIPAAVEPGMSIVYRIVVANGGPSTARNVVVADTLPAEVINTAVSSSQGGCTGFPCTLGDIEPGGSATIFVVGTVADSADGEFTNTASVTSDTAFAEGSTTSDDATATATTVADLALVKEAPSTALAGGSVVYTLTVRNLGPSAAQAVTVTDALPAGM
ncbi:MAG: DUF11 domain-containing protein, partial [Caldilinea sp.]|nr:DUF11 domain-containing protein [Caldilinea sp.]